MVFNVNDLVLNYILDKGLAVNDSPQPHSWSNFIVNDHHFYNDCSGFIIKDNSGRIVEKTIPNMDSIFTGKSQRTIVEVRGNISCHCGNYKVNRVRVIDSFDNIVLLVLRKERLLDNVEKFRNNDDVFSL